ncbi:hypothetical protein BLNAU_23342 [Blattamonas nauphoetae]|uniref:Uncharacterized protein n=1 Tax=Blattamonas nauphoetae TaxID=2049346 RepID=A0ABQ9WQL5_9EUKA|nr:hypothetical protein BLNAU_23342 [Blattamonas nauphoetae]
MLTRATRRFNPKLTRTSNRGMSDTRQTRPPLRLDLVALKSIFSCDSASDRLTFSLCGSGQRDDSGWTHHIVAFAHFDRREPADAFLGRLASVQDESLTDFIQSIVVLISTPSQPIIQASVLDSLFATSSKKLRLALVEADLISTLHNTQCTVDLFAETVSIHVHLLKMLRQ